MEHDFIVLTSPKKSGTLETCPTQPDCSEDTGLFVCALPGGWQWPNGGCLVDFSHEMTTTAQPDPPKLVVELNGIHQPWLRRVISIGLVLHFAALVIAPLAVAPTSSLWQKAWLVCRPYLEALNLNHGSHFFAPDPGPSHLVHYTLRFDDGHVEQGIFPNARQQQPRLRYHRHFMLSEFLNNLAIDDSRRELFEAVTHSYAEHLRHEHQANEVTLSLRRHYVPGPQQVSAGKRLDDLSLFAERPLGTHGSERR